MKVIIVDDLIPAIEQISRVVKATFSDADIVGTATTIHEAKDVIVSQKPDLVLLDIQMDKLGTNSLPFIADLSLESGVDFKLVFVSAYWNENPAKKIRDVGIDLLAKPVDSKKLKAAVDNAFSVDRTARAAMMKMLCDNDAKDFNICDIEGRNTRVSKSDIIKIKTIPKVSQADAEKKNIPENKTAKLYFELTDGRQFVQGAKIEVSITSYAEQFSEDGFVAAGAHVLINLAHVSHLTSLDMGVVLKNGRKEICSRRHWKTFEKAYKNYKRANTPNWIVKLWNIIRKK
ncbi:MAG: hypothetical protein RLZZ628_2170 [Bacteroidota bacterium]|jgi:DNA-binding LytR/AlgR family response regulator